MKARTWGPLTAATLLLVSGCSGLTPGTASVVGDDRITVSEVDDLTRAQCDLAEQAVVSGQGQVTSLAVEKQRSLGILISLALNEQFAASEGVEAPAEVRQFVVSQNIASLQQFPPDVVESIRPVVERFAVSQADLAQVAAEAAGEELTPQNIGQYLEEGQAQLEEWQDSVEITTDPRFDPGPDGQPGGGDGSVSRAGSDFAQQAEEAAGAQGGSFASALPPGQRCGG